MALGAFNGLLVWKLDIPPIVVTLGTLTIYRGIIFVLSDGKWVNAHEMSGAFKVLPRTMLAGLPVLSWIAIAVVLAMVVLLKRTAFGRALYAVGGNPTAAIYTGIDVGRTRFVAFTAAGAIAGLSGYLWVARYAVAYVDIAGGFELDVIAACVIGGVSIAGGIGSVGGAVLGALFPRRHQKFFAGGEHLAFLAARDFRQRDHHRRCRERPRRAQEGPYHSQEGGGDGMNDVPHTHHIIPDRMESRATALSKAGRRF